MYNRYRQSRIRLVELHYSKQKTYTTDFDTFNLVAKSDLIALKAAVDKQGISKLVNVLTSFNILKKRRWFACW